jgi:hypothetical protein
VKVCDRLPDEREIICFWRPVPNKLYWGGHQLHSNWTRVAANRMQIVPVPAWLPVAGIFLSILFMLLATGGHAGTICMQLAATREQFLAASSMRFLNALAARTVQSPQFFESTLPEQLFE